MIVVFAGAGVAHHGDGLARLNGEADIAQYPILVLVGEPDLVEFDRAMDCRAGKGALGVTTAGWNPAA
jgi:hypothetical protein